MTDTMSVMLTVQDVATRYRVTRATVLSWIASGELLAIDVAPSGKRRSLRIAEGWVAEFERSRATKPPLNTPTVAKCGKIRDYFLA